jgi:HEAT repeat protein
MRNDSLYRYLLEECQSDDPECRLKALEDIRRHNYLDLLEAQFLLDRLNSTSHAKEQTALLWLMCEIKKPLPVDALMAILADWETTSVFLRMEVAHTLAVVKADEALDLFLRILQDPEEHPWLREAMTEYLTIWGKRISDEFLLRLLTDPNPAVCAAVLTVLRHRPSQTIPFAVVLPYCAHEEPYVREEALKTLLATEQRIPPAPILAALTDPDPQVRAAASFGCISLLERFGDQIPLEPLLQALLDEYAAVRENILDALGKVPLRAPVEPVAQALNDATYYVRCAAAETLGLMGKRVPSSLYPLLEELSRSDPSPQVRIRAARSLLLVHGMQPPPLELPIVEIS